MTAHPTSLAQRLAQLDPLERAAVLEGLSEDAAAAILEDWLTWARPDQLAPPGDWTIWLILAGRGWGKTKTGAEDVKRFALENPGARIAVVAPTYADARDTCIEGESGLLACLLERDVDAWNRSLGELSLTNGSRFKLFSSEEPERLRGPQHHRAWGDELAAWKYPQDTFDMLMFGLRLGTNPQAVFTTTPKPIKLVKDLVARASRGDVHLTRGRTFDNAPNLAPSFITQIIERYRGTRLSRQELEAELLEDVPGALWTFAQIEAARLDAKPPTVQFDRIVVAIDPAATSDEGSDETGIVVAARGSDERLYVLADLSLKASPQEWATVAVRAYERFSADRIVAEGNNGGDMIEAVIRTVDPSVSYRKVTASRGKVTRAEPIAALYEQSRASHIGTFPELESQMCGWMPGQPSPDRMDALVWAASDLMLGPNVAISATANPFATLRSGGRDDRDTPGMGGEFGGRRGGATRRRPTRI